MKTFLKAFIVIILIVAVIGVGIPVALSCHRTVYIVTVMDMTEDSVYVYNGAVSWRIENVDRWYLDKDSAEIADTLKVGYSFMIDVAGYQMPVIGVYENIVHADGIGGS